MASVVAAMFDGRVLTLKKACLAIRKGNPTDVDIIDDGSARRARKGVEKSEKEALFRLEHLRKAAGSEAWQRL
jgi:hypothetical protein